MCDQELIEAKNQGGHQGAYITVVQVEVTLAQTIISLPWLGIFFDLHFSFMCPPSLMPSSGLCFYSAPYSHWKQAEVPRMQILRHISMEEVY